jgi:hypothetical protein
MGQKDQPNPTIQTINDLKEYYLHQSFPTFRQKGESFFQNLVEDYTAAPAEVIKIYSAMRLGLQGKAVLCKRAA